MGVTKDDERALRISSLALEFMNARAPVPSSAVQEEFYPGLSADSFRKAFSRDRSALLACGLVIEERPARGSESSWEANAELSFASGAELDPMEAAALDVACRPLLDEGEFPLAGDLRLALAKITRAFAESVVAVPAHERATSRHLPLICGCLISRHAIAIDYANARGETSQRSVAPLGLFSLRGRTYLVAMGVDGEDQEVRTYRVDRILKARELAGVTYEVPEDFSVSDWRLLPFQMGSPVANACFHVPASREAEVRRASLGHGLFEAADDGALWTVSASSLEDAAAWAVSQGIRPVSPAPLVDAWEHVLRGACPHAR